VIRNQTLTSPLEGCQSGLGLLVQSSNDGTSTVTVRDSSVHAYQKNGITGAGSGTQMMIRGNTVMGQGPTSGAAENGIQIGFGAGGTITRNSVINDIFSSPSTTAVGILVIASPDVVVSSNTVGATQSGIAILSDPDFGPADGA